MKTTVNRMLITLAALALGSAAATASTYDQTILNDRPAMFLGMDTPGSGSQADLSGNGHGGTYIGGTPPLVALPNGDKAADFNGSSEYLTVPAAAALSVPTAKALTIESWIRPDTLQFSHSEGEGYVYWLGKGNPSQGYEYANRMYSLTNTANRPNRISDYDWNVSGGLGSGAYFQDPVTVGQWIYVTDVINMNTGYIDIYKNGVLRGHVPLSQYSVTPGTTQAPFNVGTRNNNSWFQGAIGKVAVFPYALTAAQIANHYAAMTAPASGTTSSATAPAISGVAAANITQTGATVNWTTDQASLSQVEYGLTTSYGSLTPQSTTAGTSHSVALSGLTAGTVYHYRVKSLDSTTGLTGVSADYTFTTQAASVASSSVISNVTASGITSSAANITWNTTTNSHSQVEYGVSTSYGSLSYQSTATGVSHFIPLSGLKAGTVYHYRVKSLDSSTGLTAVSGDYTFTTTGGTAAPTPTAPAVSGVASTNVTQTGATIGWLTDKASYSQVEYGLSSGYGSSTAQTSSAVTSHSVALSGLTAGTVYHYRVKSLDPTTGLTGVSGDFTFTTQAASVASASVISNVTASGITSSAANITWNTTTVSHSQVEYGVSTSYGSLSYQSSATGTSHFIPLSGLKAGTVYHYRVKSLDSSTGLTAVSGDYTFTTTGAVATAPAVSGVASSNVTQSGASIGWLTDKASYSQVEYGLSSGYGSSTAQTSSAVTSHSVALSGLTAGTVYHYRVKSLDPTTGLTGVSGDFTFTTQAATVASASVISNVTATNITSSAANITWKTTTVSHSQVEYGLTTAYGSQSYQSTATGTSHWIPLSGLKAGTVYHYRVKSLDSATGQTAVSGDYTFKTSGTAGA